MKRILILALGVLMVAGAVQAQTNERALVAKARAAIDSIAAAVNAPTPVTVSENVVFTNLSLCSTVHGSASNLEGVGGNHYRTFPVAGGVDVHGAKALYLVLDWADYEHGVFTVTHLFGPSASDTLFAYHNGTKWCTGDTITIGDTLTADSLRTLLPHNVAGSLVLRVPQVPGGGYYFCKIKPWGSAVGLNWITGLNATLVVVQ